MKKQLNADTFVVRAKDFAKEYAEMFGTTRAIAIEDCEKFWEVLGKLLYEDRANITIYGFGSFKQKIKASKRVRHPATKELLMIPEKPVVKFVQTTLVD